MLCILQCVRQLLILWCPCRCISYVSVFFWLCSYDDVVAAGFSVAELHLEDRIEGGSSDSDSDCEFANSDDWEAADAAHSDDGAAVPAGHVLQATASSSSSGPLDGQTLLGSGCSTPKQLAAPQQQQAGSADGASESTDSGSGLATVVLSNTRSDCTPATTGRDAVRLPDTSRLRQRRAAGISSKGSHKDLAAAGSVTAAALQVASRKSAAPAALSQHKLTAEANRNLTGQEKKEKGGLSALVLGSYINAAGGLLVALLVLGVMVTEQGSRVLTDTFLGWWAADVFHQGLWFYIGIYAGLGVLYSLLTFVR
jgi:hypothetical protein